MSDRARPQWPPRPPGVVTWYGRYTRRWWALIPAGAAWRLIEAGSPDELASAIAAAASAWPARPSR